MLRGQVVVLVTTPENDAEKIAQTLVRERLAACVNIVRDVKSIYWWEGRVEEGKESLLIVKTSYRVLARLEARIREIHPYSVPEIIAIPIIAGSKNYLDWVEEEVGDHGSSGTQPG